MKAEGGRKVHPTIKAKTPEFLAWKRYFDLKLGWRPVMFERLVEWPDAGHQFTVPELNPEWFDTSYQGGPCSGQVTFQRTTPRLPEHLPGRRANVFIPASNSQFAQMVERAKTGDDAEFRHDMSGIWVAEGWVRPAGYTSK